MSYQLKQQIISKIKDKKNRNIAIVMHNKPDGDSIGSAIALEEALITIGKKVDLIIHNKISDRYASIIGKNRVNKIFLPNEGKRYDLLIMLDFSDPNRTIDNLRRLSKTIIVIDHHIYTKPYGDIHLCENVSSTGIIVYSIIKKLTAITNSIATSIYLTIVADTLNFRNSNVDQKTHRVAAELIENGACLNTINEIMDGKALSFIHLMGQTLRDVQFDKNYKITYLAVTRDKVKAAKSSDEDVLLLIDQIRNIKNSDITFLFIEGISNVRISARSIKTPVNEILNHFGGGGHEKAAGCAIEDKSIDEVVEEVLDFTRKFINMQRNKK